MARGDYIEVLIRTVSGSDKHKISATSDGRNVEVDIPQRPADLFVEVREVTRGGTTVRKALFNKGDVVGIVTGHETAKRKAKTS